jgi:hypothetical protein
MANAPMKRGTTATAIVFQRDQPVIGGPSRSPSTVVCEPRVRSPALGTCRGKGGRTRSTRPATPRSLSRESACDQAGRRRRLLVTQPRDRFRRRPARGAASPSATWEWRGRDALVARRRAGSSCGSGPAFVSPQAFRAATLVASGYGGERQYGERVPPRRQNGGVKPGSAGLAHTSDLGRERRAHQVVDLLRRDVLHLRGDVLRTRRRLQADPGATLSGSFCVRG